MAAFRASLHAPSSMVCSAAESVNSSEDELPFDENIPPAGYKEQDEEEDKDAIGDVESVSSQSCCIRPRIKLKLAFDTRNVFLNLWSVYVFHTSSNHPLLRGSRRHDRSAVVFSEEIRKAERKKTSHNNIRLTVKWKMIFCCISFLLLFEFCKSFKSSNLRRRLLFGAIFVTAYRCTDYCANPALSSTLARRLNWIRACAVLLSNPILIRFGTAEARRMNWALDFGCACNQDESSVRHRSLTILTLKLFNSPMF